MFTVEELDPVEGWVTIASLEPGLGQEPDMWASVPSTSCMALVQVKGLYTKVVTEKPITKEGTSIPFSGVETMFLSICS